MIVFQNTLFNYDRHDNEKLSTYSEHDFLQNDRQIQTAYKYLILKMPWFGALKLILFLTDLRRRKAYPLCNCYIMSIKENSYRV